MSKIIGILGGLSFKSTIFYYKYVNKKYLELFDDYPHIIVNSINLNEFNNSIYQGEKVEVKNIICRGLDTLVLCGSEVLLIASNTPHFILPEIKNKFSVPIISIVDSLKDELSKHHPGRLLLLGTQFTMESDYYRKGLGDIPGLEIYVPDKQSRSYINEIIFRELARGIITPESGDFFQKLIFQFREERGIDGVILGCTELPLILTELLPGLKYYHTPRIHCNKLIQYIKLSKNTEG